MIPNFTHTQFASATPLTPNPTIPLLPKSFQLLTSQLKRMLERKRNLIIIPLCWHTDFRAEDVSRGRASAGSWEDGYPWHFSPTSRADFYLSRPCLCPPSSLGPIYLVSFPLLSTTSLICTFIVDVFQYKSCFRMSLMSKLQTTWIC